MTRPTLTDAEILAQIPAARQRARVSGGIAVQARYARASRHLRIVLTSRASLLIPVELVASLRDLSDADLARVEITSAGMGLSWQRSNVDLSVMALVELALGRRTLMRAAGTAGGTARSAAKARASRANGLKGGRPRTVR